MKKTRRLDSTSKIKCIINPKHDFILVKQLADTREYIIGVTDNYNLNIHYIYGKPMDKKMYAMFLNGYFENNNILLSQLIGINHLLLGYQIISKRIIYSVIVFNENSEKKVYTQLYNQLDSAKNDFRRMLYDLSLTYYKEVEEGINETLDYFINFIMEDL